MTLLDARRPEAEAPYWSRARVTLVVMVYIMALGIAPLAHAWLSIAGVISSPDTLDDFACASCHAANRGHIVPPDRSCLSCHPMDFGRHLSSTRHAIHAERLDPTFALLVLAYGLFTLGALLFVLKPNSPRRALFVTLTGLALGGIVAAAFGGGA